MDIVYSREPVVGENFDFDVVDFRGTALIQVSVAGRVIGHRRCPDPPCHETMAIRPELRGETLIISALDTSGATALVELEVVA